MNTRRNVRSVANHEQRRGTRRERPHLEEQPIQHESPQYESMKEMLSGLSVALGSKAAAIPYDGKSDVVQWLEGYENIADSWGWTDAAKVRQLRSHLSHLALKWFIAEETRNQLTRLPWAVTKEKLLRAFKPDTYEMDLRKQLKRPQAANEDILEFFEERCVTCSRMGLSEAETIQHVIDSLRVEYYSRVADKHFNNLDDLRSKLRKMQSKGQHVNTAAAVAAPRRIEPPRPVVSHSKAPECFNCRKPGHRARDCRAPQYQQQWKAAVRNPTTMQRREPYARHEGRPVNQYKGVYNGPRALLPAATTQPETAKALEANKVDVKPYPAIFLPITVEGVSLEAELDSGAAISCIDSDYFKRLDQQKKLLLERSSHAIRAAGSLYPEVDGVTQLTIGYWDCNGRPQVVTLSAVVMPRLGNPILLGRDFKCLTNMGYDLLTQVADCRAPMENHQWPTKILLKYGKLDGSIGATKRAKQPHGKVKKPKRKRSTTETTSFQAPTSLDPPAVKTMREADQEEKMAELLVKQARLEANESKVSVNTEPTEYNEQDLIWGSPYVIEDGPFVDDPFEDRVNPYIFQEQVEALDLPEGQINVGVGLNPDDKQRLAELIHNKAHAFAFNGELGDCGIGEHQIDTGDAKPSAIAPFRRAAPERQAVQAQIDTWLQQGVIRHSNSPWSTRVVTVRKKDNTLRCCVDYRSLNAVTERDVYPLPTREEIFASLNGKTYFSSLDLNQGYLQIRMRPEDISKTAFVVQSGLYEFLRMPFGLTNAPATFQRLMDRVLGGLKWKACLVYLDDIIVYGQTLEEHNQNLLDVLNRVVKANLTLKPSKCALAVREIKFLGHIICAEGIRMDPEKVASIAQAPRPRDVKGVRSFIGLASYYRQFVENFAQIAKPLTYLTQKEVPFEWESEQQEAFDELVKRLTTQPVMCHFNHELPIELRTDASDYGIGAILLHEFPDKSKRVVEYASRLLKPHELNYAIPEKECLAIVWAVTKFRMYLQGVKFTVVTDHLALTWLKRKKDLQSRLMRWANLLSPYHFEIVYKSGKLHKDADHLSRHPIVGESNDKTLQLNYISYGRRGTYNPATATEGSEDETECPPGVDIEELIEAQQTDSYCQTVMANKDERFTIEEGLLVYIDNQDPRATQVSKVVIPEALLDKVLYAVHDDPTSGHSGIRKTLRRFGRRYFAHRQSSKIKNYVKTCHLCQTKKRPWKKRQGLLQPLQVTRTPFERVGIDTLGPFKRSRQGNEKIIVATDYFTRWAIAKAVPKENADVLADMMIKEIFLKYGAPQTILTDRGKSFGTALMRSIYREFDIKHVTSTAYHPQTNGLTERLNHTLAVMLSMYVNQHHQDWDEYVPYVVFAYNTNVQDSSGFSPYYLMHGREARLPSDLVDPNPLEFAPEHFERLHQARERAAQLTLREQEGQKTRYDKGRGNLTFEAGDWVVVYHPRGYAGQTTKLRHPFKGPYEVIEKQSDLNYLVRECYTDRPHEELFHVTRLKPYYRRETNVRDPKRESK